MSEYNLVVINWAIRAKPAGLSFLIVNLGVPGLRVHEGKQQISMGSELSPALLHWWQ